MNYELEKIHDNPPIMVGEIPNDIWNEIDSWVDESRKIKDHPLKELKAYENAAYLEFDGKIHNSYQSPIPSRLIEESFWFPYVLRLSSKYWWSERDHRSFRLRKMDGHFYGYEIWTNFSYKGDDNPLHNHSGFLSGVIFYKNNGHPIIFPQYGIGYEGKDKTMILFPSFVPHCVEQQTTDTERITIAFNLSIV